MMISLTSSVLLLIAVLFYGRGKLYKPHCLYFFWVVWFWVTVLMSRIINPQYAFGWKTIMMHLLPGYVLCIFFSYSSTATDLIGQFERALIYGCELFLCYIVLMDGQSLVRGQVLRLGSSASGNVNTAAMYLCYCVTMIYYLIVIKQRKKLLPLFALSCLAILLTGSKKGVVGVCIILALVSIYRYKWKVWKYVSVCIGALILYYLIRNNELFYQALGRRIDKFFADLMQPNVVHSSTGERVDMYRWGVKFFLQEPLFGNGYGYFAANSGWGTYSHSNYMELLVSFGAVGTLIYYSIFLSIIVKSISHLSENTSILFLTFCVEQLFFDSAAVNFYDNPFMYLFLYVASRYFYEMERVKKCKVLYKHT